MRLVFAGTPEFGERVLTGVVAAGHEVVLVLTQPDRPAGRGLHPVASRVKRFATTRDIPVLQPSSLKGAPVLERVRVLRPDAIVVAAYGLILPPTLFDAARYGALNVHASLLPRWRGAAPIQRALLAGDAETGVSIMQMDAGLDSGAVLLQRRIPIARDDDAGSLHDKLAALGADTIVGALADIETGRARASPQPQNGVTHATKVAKAEARLDWTRPASELERAVRAFRPSPGAFALLEREPVKIWRAEVFDFTGEPGTLRLVGDKLVVACGEQALAILELQRAGGRALSAAEFLRGRLLPADARFA
ncbi:MAG TPA: methionyl-tRNA formyltransferase [Burkholderiales bacterium]|nr:methionyl-tRNA formyltransferase [Burkholderiales bacterium]